jgi:hypothetical protein
VFFFAAILLGALIFSCFLAIKLESLDAIPPKWGIGVPFLALAFCYALVWPHVIRLEEWRPHFKYWLPKSRVVGYSVYLLLPIAVMALLFYLGIRR